MAKFPVKRQYAVAYVSGAFWAHPTPRLAAHVGAVVPGFWPWLRRRVEGNAPYQFQRCGRFITHPSPLSAASAERSPYRGFGPVVDTLCRPSPRLPRHERPYPPISKIKMPRPFRRKRRIRYQIAPPNASEILTCAIFQRLKGLICIREGRALSRPSYAAATARGPPYE